MRIVIAVLLVTLSGCAVHDGKGDQDAPVWWPTPFYRDEPANGQHWDVSTGEISSAAHRPSFSAPQDVRALWDPIYSEHAIVPVPPSSDLTLTPPNGPQPPATLYPNRGEAAQAAGSATLYPPANSFVVDPSRNASVYPRGPLAPTGFRGK